MEKSFLFLPILGNQKHALLLVVNPRSFLRLSSFSREDAVSISFVVLPVTFVKAAIHHVLYVLDRDSLLLPLKVFDLIKNCQALLH